MSRQDVHTLASLFGEVGRVEIPIVQRDYAQGRPEERHVREAFLAALGDALRREDGDPTAQLNLDFVYGSFDEKSATFAVLDGQRLTTLFLLHWYCALRDDRVADFRVRFSNGGQARFTYATRESAARQTPHAIREFQGVARWQACRRRPSSRRVRPPDGPGMARRVLANGPRRTQ